MVISKPPKSKASEIPPEDSTERQATSLHPTYLKFTKCDRCLFNFLHQHSTQLEQSSLPSVPEPIQPHCQPLFEQVGWVVLTIDGQVKYMTPRAEQLIHQYFLIQTSQTLPPALIRWFKDQITQPQCPKPIPISGFPLHLEQTEHQLTIRLIPSPIETHYLLLLEEQEPPTFSIASLELLGLTKREAEVLFWIAKDKSNAGIAKILGCCEGTVRKHLENLYKKLRVQTRIGAVMIALEKLGLIKG
ncbi:helix-turn-helix transcriptional regulator [Egbenema bharatensis]|uniref:helix-turn-helix transcriptional regulator n=1 Tax=Egbenema bharatensis TaxID=3463334 RepID=UPI003A8AC5AA